MHCFLTRSLCSIALLAALPGAISQTLTAQLSPSMGPSTASIEREYVIRDIGIVDTQRKLIFSRCLYGQTYKSNRCAGTAEKVSASEALDARSEARLHPWRLPTADELNALLKYYLPRDDFTVPHGTPLLTSTPAARGYRVVQFASFRVHSSGALLSMQSDSETVPQPYILLVRSAGGDEVKQSSNDPNDIEQALLDYVIAIEGMRKLALQPICNYVSVKTDLPRAPYAALTVRLPPRSRKDFEAFIQSSQWNKNLERIGLSHAEFERNFGRDLDAKTKCGLWAGYSWATLRAAKVRFEAFR
jgi:hypothetical protein